MKVVISRNKEKIVLIHNTFPENSILALIKIRLLEFLIEYSIYKLPFSRRRRRDGMPDMQPHTDGEQHGLWGQHLSTMWRKVRRCLALKNIDKLTRHFRLFSTKHLVVNLYYYTFKLFT